MVFLLAELNLAYVKGTTNRDAVVSPEIVTFVSSSKKPLWLNSVLNSFISVICSLHTLPAAQFMDVRRLKPHRGGMSESAGPPRPAARGRRKRTYSGVAVWSVVQFNAKRIAFKKCNIYLSKLDYLVSKLPYIFSIL